MVLTEHETDHTTDHTVICLRGELDAFNAGALSETIARAMALGDGDLVLDLSAVEFMAVATAGVLCHTGELLRLQSRSLVLRSPSRCSKRVLDLCGLTDRFELRSAADGGP